MKIFALREEGICMGCWWILLLLLFDDDDCCDNDCRRNNCCDDDCRRNNRCDNDCRRNNRCDDDNCCNTFIINGNKKHHKKNRNLCSD